MLRATYRKWVKGALSIHRDTQKTPRLVKEVGQWLYQPQTTKAFQAWCRTHDVRAYGSMKMTTTPHFARCLRATRQILPGEAIVTCPLTSCFNFLTVAREQFEDASASSAFPLPLSWSNYNERLPFLKSASTAELATAGWMVRIASLENSPFTPYIHFLLEDTRGRDGIANGLSKEREDDSGMVDHYFSELATDAAEDPEVFLEHLFRSFACIHLRTQPIEAEAIEAFIPGTNFFKAKARQMHVPTLMPLIDCVPQVEDETHNCLVQYFPFPKNLRAEEREAEESRLLKEWASELRLSQESGAAAFNRDRLRGGGMFALRAIRPIEPGDVLYLRHYAPEGDVQQNGMTANVIEANRLLHHEN